MFKILVLAYPDLECGGECSFACPYGFPCEKNKDCVSGHCGDQNFCLFSAPSTPTLGSGTPTPTPGSGSSGSSGKKKVGEVCSSDSECTSNVRCAWGKCQKYWESLNFNDDFFGSKWNVVKNGHGLEFRSVVADPEGGSDKVLKFVYPEGSRNPSGPIEGGSGIYVNPIDLSQANTVTFEFQLYFPDGFDFVKGGKLPGIFGGSTGCSGGAKALNCFSTRYMWRTAGAGEIYFYADKSAQVSNFCTLIPNIICNPVYGWSIGRGSWTFKTGQWNTVRQTIQLNSFASNGDPNPDGVMTVWFNGNSNPSLYLNKVVFRTSPTIGVNGLTIESFFGGSSDSFNTPKTQSMMFKGFKVGGF